MSLHAHLMDCQVLHFNILIKSDIQKKIYAIWLGHYLSTSKFILISYMHGRENCVKGKSSLSQKLPYFKQRWMFSKTCKFEMILHEMWEEFVLERTKGFTL